MRLDAMMGREYTNSDGEKKTAWTRIGVAWPQKNGGYTVVLDALPAATMDNNGNVVTRFSLFEPRANDRQNAEGMEKAKQAAHGAYDPSDDIPW